MTTRLGASRAKAVDLGKAQEALLLGSFIVLPYASYGGLVGAGLVLLSWLAAYPQEIWQRLHRQDWLWLMGLMGMSVLLAENPVQAALQSTNFWPFFIFFAGLSVYLSRLPNPLLRLEQWAFWLLVTSIPVNLLALVEYWPALATRLGLPSWLLGSGPVLLRVDAVFGNPNVLAVYLVILFGLGLGLWLKTLSSTSFRPKAWPRSRYLLSPVGWMYVALALIPLGVFCSGSRNGIMVILVQLLITGVLARRHRWGRGLSLGGITAMLALVTAWGVGGRSLSQAASSSVVRVEIWQLSFPFIRQHPWFGIGFGGFEANYEPGTIVDIPVLHHVHNLWLHLAVEAGLPVMLLFTGIIGSICYRVVRYYQRGRLSPLAQGMVVSYGLGSLACTLSAVFDVPVFDARVNLLGWLMLAVLQAIPDQTDRINS
ncbi:MAG: O-antigen ligase family protein [Leptolyngbya sp.]|nr:O-antigen ligase family protein [Leptolyngbya sp.]